VKRLAVLMATAGGILVAMGLLVDIGLAQGGLGVLLAAAIVHLVAKFMPTK
jgi:hypothetical protein